MPLEPSPATRGLKSETIYSPQYLSTTLGMFVLVFLVAFESMAVTTAMPLIVEVLDGQRYFALSFAAPMASGMLGMVAAGEITDRRGPKTPLFASVAVFSLGLLVCGTAASMQILIIGRVLQGIGGGAITVAIYVLIARAYPPALHTKIFALFAAAWVLPALIGPWIAGLIAVHIGWRWVFLGVMALVVLAFAAVLPTLSRLPKEHNTALGPVKAGRLLLAAATGAAVIGMNLLGNTTGALAYAGLAAALLLALLAIRPLLPVGSLTARRGLPATISARALVAAAFFGVEVYLPYMLREDYAMSPDRAGLVLTASAVSWSIGSWLQGRLGERISNRSSITMGAAAGTLAIATALATSIYHPSVVVLMAGWALGGFGMGMIFPRLNVNMLALSAKHEQGFNSSALTLADSLGNASSTALGGVIFAMAVPGSGFTAVFTFCLAIAVLLLVIAPRTKGAALAADRLSSQHE